MTNGSPNIALSSAKGRLALASISGPYRLASLLALIVLADWLLYDHPVGVSLLLFLLATATITALTNPVHASRPEFLRGAGLMALAFAPLLAEANVKAMGLAVLATAYVAVTLTRTGMRAADKFGDAVALLLGGWRAIPESVGGVRRWVREDGAFDHGHALLVWVVPVVLGGIFLNLFASANPLIDAWLDAIDLGALFSGVGVVRIVFWLAAASFVWPFIFMRIRERMRVKADLSLINADAPARRLPPQLFGKPAILRSLILFNLMFACQSVLDIAYLWGGVSLPDGLSYAAYAHRGAYPLVVTALLAAAFVIAATRPGSEAARSPVIRRLVFLWTAQNVLLVVSSILRLDLYVEVYSLTYLRVAAFIWMILVAVGLVLIVARIALGRSNGWLIAMNAGSLAVTLYLCFFVNFPNLIASYNVAHSREISGAGAALDIGYLMNLGPQAIPALDRFLAIRPRSVPAETVMGRNSRAASHLTRMTDWRAWSLRDWQLAAYLREKPRVPLPPAPPPLSITP